MEVVVHLLVGDLRWRAAEVVLEDSVEVVRLFRLFVVVGIRSKCDDRLLGFLVVAVF